jgi:hypothetical protein
MTQGKLDMIVRPSAAVTSGRLSPRRLFRGVARRAATAAALPPQPDPTSSQAALGRRANHTGRLGPPSRSAAIEGPVRGAGVHSESRAGAPLLVW